MAKRESWRSAISKRNELRWTEEAKQRQSESSKENWNPERRERAAEFGREQAKLRGGIPNAVKFTRERVSGENNNRWKGGITPETLRIRHSEAYQSWLKAVMSRDHHTCQICKVRGGRLNTHHVLGFADHPALRFDVNNGLTLCWDCHLQIAHRGAFQNPGISREELNCLTAADSPVAISW